MISIIILLPLIYNAKQKYNEAIFVSEYINRDNAYPYHNFTTKMNEINKLYVNKINNQTNSIESYETNNGVFEPYKNTNSSYCNDIDLDLGINPDLFDVSSFVLTDYFNLNPDELERILNEESNEEFYNINEKNAPKFTNDNTLKDSSEEVNEFNLVNTNNFSSIKNFIDVNSIGNQNLDETKQSSTKFNQEVTNESVFKIKKHVSSEHIESFRNNIKYYIKCVIAKHLQDFYLRRLEGTTKKIDFLDEFQLAFDEKKFSYSLNNNQELENVLRLLFKKFGNEMSFNQETSKLFMKELKLHKQKLVLSHYENLYLSYKEEKALKFYYEFMKLYKYVYYIPEILTLGGLVNGNLYGDPEFIIHLINLFIEKIGKPNENIVFIKFIIHNAFLNSNKKSINIFLIPALNLKCKNTHRNLQFFSWEIHGQIRLKIKKKICENYNYEIDNTEMDHMRVVLLLFLYQHIIFLKYNSVSIEDLSTLSNFVNRVIESNECVGCIFDDFLKITKTILKN